MQCDHSCGLGEHRVVGSRKAHRPGLDLGNEDYRTLTERRHAQPVLGAREQHMKVTEVRGRK